MAKYQYQIVANDIQEEQQTQTVKRGVFIGSFSAVNEEVDEIASKMPGEVVQCTIDKLPEPAPAAAVEG